VENINQIRIISIWIFIVTFVSLNLCLFISVNGHLLQGTIFQVDPMGRSLSQYLILMEVFQSVELQERFQLILYSNQECL